MKSPGDFASDAWNTEKLINAYEARKKFEIIGAITFNSAARETRNKFNVFKPTNFEIFLTFK